MWFRKKTDIQNELLFQVREVNQKLQQVMDENRRLQNDVKKLKEDIKQKDQLIIKEKKKYKIFDGMLLSAEQSAVVDLLETTSNCYFITGKAGTGKSTILKYFIATTTKKVVALAPTGIAANIISGRTIHSFFGLAPKIQDVNDPVATSGSINAEPKLIEELEAIVIDEASMVRSDVMDMIDHKLRTARDNPAPYGGIQIILFGDLFQLPPVVTKGEEGKIIQNRYHTPYFFGAPSVEKSFVVCGLTQIFRQTDVAFIRILNKIRIGKASQTELDELNKLCVNNNSFSKNDMVIVPTNRQVNVINKEKLSLLPTEEFTYYAISEGDATEDDTPTTDRITLKVGATVMLLSNDINKNYINGTLAEVVELAEDMIKVRIPGIGIISIDPYTWTKYQYIYNADDDRIETKETGSFTQYPIKLAYAITVHKSQGQTFEHATIDYEKAGAFAAGQTYVALSRCRRLEDIMLSIPLRVQDIIVNHEAMDYLNRNAVPALQYAKEHLSF